MTFQQGVLGDGELTNTAKWYWRVLKVINDLLQTLRGETAWQPATLAGTWTAVAGFAAPGYRIRDGILYLTGVVTGGSVTQTIFTLPAGYRPTANVVLGTYASSTFVRIDVSASTGAVGLVETGTGGSPANIYLTSLCVPLS